MSLRNRNGLAVLLRVVILFISYFSVKWLFLDWFSQPLRSFLYVSGFSFLLIIAVTIVYLILGFRTRITGRTDIPRALQIMRFAAAVFALFAFILGWTIDILIINDLRELSPFTMLIEGFIPLLFFLDFLLFDRGAPMAPVDLVPAIGPPIAFTLYTLLYTALQNGFMSYNDHPYYFFFTDLNSYGLLGIDLGIVWSMLILYGSTFAIAYFLRWIQLKTIKPEPKEE